MGLLQDRLKEQLNTLHQLQEAKQSKENSLANAAEPNCESQDVKELR